MKLFLNDNEFESYIYRITPFKYFVNSLISKTITFSSIEKWNDPFENFIFGREHKRPNGEVFSFDRIKNSLYAQCWTFNEESDFSWKVYSPDLNGIKIKTKLNIMYDNIMSVVKENNIIRVGKVRYLSVPEIKSEYEVKFNKYRFQLYELKATESLLTKREIYNHEKEVRFLLLSEQFDHKKDFLELHIDYRDFIESISLDPRITKSEFDQKASYIKNLGFSGDIYQSDIYQMPELSIDFEFLFEDE